MKTCIICRKSFDESLFNDEHVIPDALGGCYHVNNICTKCNSEIGHAIDSKLTNHFFSNFERYNQKLKGKKGDIPNPFAGTHILSENPKQKVRFDLINGKFSPYLIPKTEVFENQLIISVDGKDIDELPKIVDRKRKKLEKEGKIVTSNSEYIERETAPYPEISINSTIDINDFKLSMLKIAYEFTIDIFTDYFNDPQAVVISSVIKNKDFKYNGITFIGDGFIQDEFRPFAHLFEFENKAKHYLLLCDLPNIGLVCGVNIFSTFNIFIVMSKMNYINGEDFIVGVNNIPKKTFKIYHANEVFNTVFNEYHQYFQYYFKTNDELETFKNEQSKNSTSVYKIEQKTPLFNKDGVIKYKDISEKIVLDDVKVYPYGDFINEFGESYIFNEELYIKVMPSNRLIQVESVVVYRKKTRKL